ncbi:hypothetical protein B9Q02_01550 [Candidatus Marsarchaeota G1 archaeon BE_D]|jgi:VIT1/CCC1 family predicted Fe2+/Mn2+ transporter|uniref:Rubrerythrin diiron-binding domain-containing protein n=1 Tax=Candidatus Marsarchaeota G1 archaeon BE_D TaxID=1978156 RepID=A0A2R6AJW0_9ARCH|nr:MAG: hypothetical protein B9Q02_01550 [Candidatus Marsarchaeota G1 archaeon BE_D]
MIDISKNYTDEVFNKLVYEELLKSEKDGKLVEVLKNLAQAEERHAEFWKKLAISRGISLPKIGYKQRIGAKLYKLFRTLFGISLTVKLLESTEQTVIRRYKEYLSMNSLSEEEKAELEQVLKDEVIHERLLTEEEFGFSNVRDTIYGVSDGLVEVLAAVSGFASVFVNPILVAAGGLIVGASGTLSMSVGAYLSTKSEEEISRSEGKKVEEQLELDRTSVFQVVKKALVEKGLSESTAEVAAQEIVKDDTKIKEFVCPPIKVSAKRSAMTTAFSYILGFIPPVLPYLAGLGGLTGLILSYTLSAIALLTVGFLVGVSSDVKPWKKSLEMLALGIGAALATHALGIVASIYLHINV